MAPEEAARQELKKKRTPRVDPAGLGYMSYGRAGGGFDRTYGFCYHDGL